MISPVIAYTLVPYLLFTRHAVVRKTANESNPFPEIKRPEFSENATFCLSKPPRIFMDSGNPFNNIGFVRSSGTKATICLPITPLFGRPFHQTVMFFV
ncbi:hypothetical protein Trydic_g470 [Trypoxylus dichotomus]